MLATLKKKLGLMAEENACVFLQARGFHLITRNYRCPFGEIDLIMQDGEEIVFIEVRSRTHKNPNDAIESIDQLKQKKLLKSAIHFLQKRNQLDKVICRFDVVGFSGTQIKWIKDAFSYE
jgi:putative endonuclease